ncbi:hypothetical protein [Mesosutterella multiformis]|uniref:hypothetical protein n=1 Tax=Mesosutterella multiformis TaxID=2259133 RepID=UPI00157C1BE0|nr:hypothetical protein [Mesosutterella multiformis]
MTTLTKILPAGSKPAPVLLARMKQIPLISAFRAELPSTFEAGGEAYEVTVSVDELRPLEIDDILMDDHGQLYAVSAAPEVVFHVTGDMNLMQQAGSALLMRGYRVSQTEDGFGVAADEDLGLALKQIGLTYTEVTEPFTPIVMDSCGCGCGCGGHHHHHDDDDECGCGCGGHHHHHEEEECGCGCGGHHHEHEEEECSCGCGGHHHDHEEEECGCGCGGHHHEHEEGECGCGGHHHDHEEGECCCGGHHHEHEEGECGCGGHHHEHEEGGCTCGCGSEKPAAK